MDWLYSRVEGFKDRRDARKYASSLLKHGYLRHTVNKITFSEQCYYTFGDLCQSTSVFLSSVVLRRICIVVDSTYVPHQSVSNISNYNSTKPFSFGFQTWPLWTWMMDPVVVVQSKILSPLSLHQFPTRGLQAGSRTRIQATRTHRPASRLDTRSPATVSTAAVLAASRVKVGLF